MRIILPEEIKKFRPNIKCLDESDTYYIGACNEAPIILQPSLPILPLLMIWNLTIPYKAWYLYEVKEEEVTNIINTKY